MAGTRQPSSSPVVSGSHHRPEFEVVDSTLGAVRYLEHGYPSPLVRWHCHNEYELHFIAASSGRVFVGDYIGEFRPGHLVLTGPLLPHNWITVDNPDTRFPLRDQVIQFDHRTVEHVAGQVPELRELLPLLERARVGLEFHGLREQGAAFMTAIRDSSGPSRFARFCEFLHLLAGYDDCTTLSTMQFDHQTDDPAHDRVNEVVNFVMHHYHENVTLAQVAELAGMNPSYFSRFFRKATGNTLSEFLTRIRISKACELLTTSDRRITSICHDVGYNNVANFNRRFLARKHVTPRDYRREARARLRRGEEVGGAVQ
ncbi:MAG: AraC family transcriptional regulator [Pseudomonadota bacterium]